MLPVLLTTFLAMVAGMYGLVMWIKDALSSPVRYLPGPPSANILFGNFLQVIMAEVSSELNPNTQSIKVNMDTPGRHHPS
jgi:hypothetical protein